MVHHAQGASVARLLCLAATAALALPLGGCLGGDENTRPAGEARLGAPVRLANCRDWRAGTIRERQGTIEAIKDFAGGPAGGAGGGHGNTLADDKAYDLFENYCRHDYARGFKLYKLYTRAAAFTAD